MDSSFNRYLLIESYALLGFLVPMFRLDLRTVSWVRRVWKKIGNRFIHLLVFSTWYQFHVFLMYYLFTLQIAGYSKSNTHRPTVGTHIFGTLWILFQMFESKSTSLCLCTLLTLIRKGFILINASTLCFSYNWHILFIWC